MPKSHVCFVTFWQDRLALCHIRVEPSSDMFVAKDHIIMGLLLAPAFTRSGQQTQLLDAIKRAGGCRNPLDLI